MGMNNEQKINCHFNGLPFKRTLSFIYLIEEIEKIAKDKKHPLKSMAIDALNKLEKAPELRKPIEDNNLLEKHKDLLNFLFAFVINPINYNEITGGVSAPFQTDTIYTTPKYDKLLDNGNSIFELAKDLEQPGIDMEIIGMIYQAYLIILERIHGFTINIEMPFTMKVFNKKTNQIKYLKKKISTKFLKVKPKGKIRNLTEEDFKKLFDSTEDLDLWHEKIPLDQFEFEGFVFFHYEDFTYDYAASQLKSILLDKDSILTKEGFEKIKRKVRTITDNPEMEFGMAVAPDSDTELSNNFVWHTIIPRSELKCDDYMGSTYEESFVKNRVILTDKLELKENDKVFHKFVEKDFKSHAVIPLFIENQPMGMLEFATKQEDGLNMIQIKRMHELFPVFALALKRSKEEWNDKVQSLIQEEFTAIHPTVEWRFREEANQLLYKRANNEPIVSDDIVFEEVVPIYGASDIRSSSLERNHAIQADLEEQLSHASDILNQAGRIKEMPLLDDLRFQIAGHLETVKSGLKAGDEVVILEFLKRDIDPVFSLMRDRYQSLKPLFDDYFNTLDPDLQVLYKKRKDFEDSLTIINDHVSDIIDREQEKAQDVFPHYFEKYRTDGVEYNAYIGQSLVKDLPFSEIYLKNIRLWQLLVKVQAARKIRSIQPQLPTKLDITQLILVHSNPFSIAFRQDEKKFDVAGAYNIRYEITKKRIDKAYIKGTNERVTQVGKIAIIYSHAEEIREYKQYIDYLISQKYLTNNVEELELEDLKGASGLKAIRVEVNFEVLSFSGMSKTEIEEAVKN